MMRNLFTKIVDVKPNEIHALCWRSFSTLSFSAVITSSGQSVMRSAPTAALKIYRGCTPAR